MAGAIAGIPVLALHIPDERGHVVRFILLGSRRRRLRAQCGTKRLLLLPARGCHQHECDTNIWNDHSSPPDGDGGGATRCEYIERPTSTSLRVSSLMFKEICEGYRRPVSFQTSHISLALSSLPVAHRNSFVPFCGRRGQMGCWYTTGSIRSSIALVDLVLTV